MAAKRKASRDTIRRSRRGRKAFAKSASVKEPEKTSRGKAAAPVAKTAVKPVKSKGAALPAEKAPKSKALKAAVVKAAGASASVTPVKADVAIESRDTPAGKSQKPEPRAGSETPATAALSAPLSDQQPGLVAVAATEVMPPVDEKKVHPPEKRLRDIPRYADLAGPDMVALSRKVSKVLWAFDLVDAITETSSVGNTRIFAVLQNKEAANEHIELATVSARSGRLVVQTTTTLKKDEEKDGFAISLVTAAGGILNQADVVGLRLANDLYDQKIFAQEEITALKTLNRVVLNPAPSYPFPSAQDPNKLMAYILGIAPAVFDVGSTAKMINPPTPDAGGKSLIDRQRRFALWGPALAKSIADESSFEVQVEISGAPGGNRKLKLTYRATREKSDDNSGAMDGANNTDRMKLTGLVSSQPTGKPPIQAKNVPPVHLLLQ